ncbi:hypothetical protein HF521_004269 [Silurus meridionalis]|uniref:Immunoglobulin-like beta-sandwich domain-containing protein n=1 Tax=Silurus meridionalis TaxID=175797 RepID=A0A8T0AW52_SILME|nr:hypothetical protein HF521_004269 [Silurus meridionalis]
MQGNGVTSSAKQEDKATSSVGQVKLQQPEISSAAGGPEVTRGYSFSIICFTRSQYPGGHFHLKFSGSDISTIMTQSALDHSASFQFPWADFVHQGNYSCTYEVSVSSRTFTSTSTELLVITVKASKSPYIGVGVTVGLLLLLVPVIIYFVKKQKSRRGMLNKKIDMQGAKITYEIPQGETDPDETEAD